MLRINLGCGSAPTPGWRNFDNSPSLKLARIPVLEKLVSSLLSSEQKVFISFCREHSIEFADVTKNIPVPDGSVDVLYACHLFEHLDRAEAGLFLREARRALRVGGFMRIAVPDLGILCADYLADGDADRFMERMFVCEEKPKTLLDRLRAISIGRRNHHWMYDRASLAKLLVSAGFNDVTVPMAGKTSIPDAGALDLFERADESLYVEAIKS